MKRGTMLTLNRLFRRGSARRVLHSWKDVNSFQWDFGQVESSCGLCFVMWFFDL